MPLLTSLVAPLPGETKRPIHAFVSACAEYARGAPGVTRAAIKSAFAMDTTDSEHLDVLLDAVDQGTIDRAQITDALILGEAGIYPVSVTESRLGL